MEGLGASAYRIGVISDTHGLLRPEALAALAGVQHIIHAGDIGAPGIVEALRALAPVTAIRGNVDQAAWATEYPETATVRLADVTVHVLHDVRQLAPDVIPAGAEVVISGHSHRPGFERRGGALFLNPGSAGPRRFRLPVTLAMLAVDGGVARPEVRALLE